MRGLKSGRAIPLTARGFKQGRHSWIDVERRGLVPAMRITHTLNADLRRPPDVRGLGSVTWPHHSFRSYGHQSGDRLPHLPVTFGSQLGELGLLPAIPAVAYGLTAAASAGALLGAWISSPDDEWNSPQFFDGAMRWMYSTIKAWDQESWVNDRCKWKGVNKNVRRKWVAFQQSFGEFYGDIGKTRDSWNAAVWGAGVRDSYVPAAKSFMRQMRNEWVPFFTKQCGFKPVGGDVNIVPAPVADTGGSKWEKIAMWGALGVGAIALASIARTTTDAFRR